MPAYIYDFPVVDWEVYGWICYNHRSAVIKALTKPLQPTEIRKEVKRRFPEIKISANNVVDILQLFLEKDVIRSVKIRRKARCCYELTKIGKEFQSLLYNL